MRRVWKKAAFSGCEYCRALCDLFTSAGSATPQLVSRSSALFANTLEEDIFAAGAHACVAEGHQIRRIKLAAALGAEPFLRRILAAATRTAPRQRRAAIATEFPTGPDACSALRAVHPFPFWQGLLGRVCAPCGRLATKTQEDTEEQWPPNGRIAALKIAACDGLHIDRRPCPDRNFHWTKIECFSSPVCKQRLRPSSSSRAAQGKSMGGHLVGLGPSGVMLRFAGQLGDNHPVGRRSFAHTF